MGKRKTLSGDIPAGSGANDDQPRLSTTTLQHTINGVVTYVDSAAIPGLVAPISRSDLVGDIAWVKYGTHEGFAIINDTGPAFGEGSVALHQFLHTGSIGPLQTIGPIPKDKRCSSIEHNLEPPFVSRPDNAAATYASRVTPSRAPLISAPIPASKAVSFRSS